MRHECQRGECGYAMVALLVGISIMSIALSVALPTWSAMAKREREEELIFRGQQYARAIMLYQRQYANAFPPNFDMLVQQRFLRKKYKDPMTKDGEFQPVVAGQTLPGQVQGPIGGQGPGAQRAAVDEIAARGAGARGAQQPQQLPGTAAGIQAGLIGVVSKSDATSLRIFNGRTKYSEWVFTAQQATTAAGPPGGAQNPQDGRGGIRGRGAQVPGPAVPGQRGVPPGGFPPRGGQPPGFPPRGGFPQVPGPAGRGL